MTAREYVLKLLVDRGLWPQEAETVLNQSIPVLEKTGYRYTWNRPSTEYPAQLYAVIMISISKEAVKWIDANKPDHFARVMFDHSRKVD